MYFVVRRVLTPFCKQRIPGSNPPRYYNLTQHELFVNKKFAFVRARIEHVNAMVVCHDMFEGRPYRGSLDFLQWYVNITIHCTALLIRLEPSRQLEGWPDDGVGHSHRPE
eukprot:FR740776.1.p1 GENE.FR740776.1~~FR740776.1.p1  ORF type:complete len:110 (+),score=3.60 FR740776.1:382-711(+)